MIDRQALPRIEHRYDHRVFDSGRWSGFDHRSGDILICTSYKAGTTWTQMICALLVLRTAQLDRPLTEISPWLELRADPVDKVLATYAAQTHRRFIKTHTPLDGLPYRLDATYLYVGRDPRDVFMSMINHLKNNDPQALANLFGEESASIRIPDDPNELFETWISTGMFPWEQDGFPYWSHFSHAATFWRFRHLPNVHLFHYQDLQQDLIGSMRGMARVLEIDIDDSELERLAEHARFDEMKARADQLAPDVNFRMWQDNARFFNKGTSGQWRGVLHEENLDRYAARRNALPGRLGEWLERGSLSTGDPKML